MSLEDAAKLLNKSERTLLQWVKDGKLTGKKERDPNKRGQETTFIHAGKAAAIAESLEETKEAGNSLVRKPASTPAPLQTSQIANLSATPSPPWLTLEEAARAFKVSRNRLVKMAESGQFPRTFRDLGEGSRGGRWRVLLNGKPEGELW